MRIAICDDEARDRELVKSFVRTHDSTHEIVEYSSGCTFIKMYLR